MQHSLPDTTRGNLADCLIELLTAWPELARYLQTKKFYRLPRCGFVCAQQPGVQRNIPCVCHTTASHTTGNQPFGGVTWRSPDRKCPRCCLRTPEQCRIDRASGLPGQSQHYSSTLNSMRYVCEHVLRWRVLAPPTTAAQRQSLLCVLCFPYKHKTYRLGQP